MNRNSLLRSKTPLRRKKRLRARRPTPRRSGRVRDGEYLLRVKQLPCAIARVSGEGSLPYSPPCYGPVEADHAGHRPFGRKCSDHETIPLCALHHRHRTDYVGLFGGWNAAKMRQWCDARIAETRARLGWKRAA